MAQNHLEFVWLIFKTKIFPVILQNTQCNFSLGQLVWTYCCYMYLSSKLYTRNGLSPQCVAASCCPVCSELYSQQHQPCIPIFSCRYCKSLLCAIASCSIFRGAHILSLSTNSCSTENNIPFPLFYSLGK